MLLTRQGLNQGALPEREQARLDEGRLLRVTPLPPKTQVNPAWNQVLEQVAIAAATRCVFSDAQSLPQQAPTTPSALLSTTGESPPNGIHRVTNATDVLTWLLDIPAPTGQPGQDIQHPVTPHSDALLAPEANLEPAPSPEEMLRTLEKGGNVPEALRRKLFGDN